MRGRPNTSPGPLPAALSGNNPRSSNKRRATRSPRRYPRRAGRGVVTGALEGGRAAKRLGSSLEASPLVYIAEQNTFATLVDIDHAEVCITSNAMVTNETPPADAFTLADVPGVAVVVEKAAGTKCARSWKILPTVGDDKEFPDVSPRDAQALREWQALGMVTGA